jgi:hypothetical protein
VAASKSAPPLKVAPANEALPVKVASRTPAPAVPLRVASSNQTLTERLLDALDPQGELDLGLAVVIAADLPGDAAAVLAELIHKRLRRAIASAYDRGWSARGENR